MMDNKVKNKQLNKGTGLGITVKKEVNFSEWYIQILEKVDLISYSDISGCYVIKPNAYSIWEGIQNYFNKLIKKDGVKNMYFPCFVTQAALQTESENFDGFCPEVAWIMKCGTKKIKPPIALRPTSEAIIYPKFAEWIRTQKDLPLRINQWCNVVRWEMKHCVPFIRSREFLWQEGHSAFATKMEADEEVMKILEFYRRVYEDLLAIPVTKGRKTQREKFAGADYTTTVEAFVPTCGRAIQAATSHSLGQNFSKAFKIEFDDANGDTKNNLVWQNSWGLSTRSIGIMIMVHGDDKGLRLPPRIAEIQVVIVCVPKDDNLAMLLEKANILKDSLINEKIRCVIDERNYNPGWKYNYWETMGVPFRIELGEKDVSTNSVVVCRRDNFQKIKVPIDLNFIQTIRNLIDEMHNNLYTMAKTRQDDHTKMTDNFDEFVTMVKNKNMVLIPFCGEEQCEDSIKERSKGGEIVNEETELTGSAKSLCIPYNQPLLIEGTKCLGCNKNAMSWCLFGKSY